MGIKFGSAALSHCMRMNYLSHSSTKVLSFNNDTINYGVRNRHCHKLSCSGIQHFSDFGISLIRNFREQYNWDAKYVGAH